MWPGMATDVSSPGSPSPAIDYFAFLKRKWTGADFLKLALLLGIGGTLYYFYGVMHIYQNMPLTHWAWGRYDEKYNSEQGKLVPLIFAWLVWHHRDAIARAKVLGDNRGLIWIVLGCLIFTIGARTLQGRMGMTAAPILLYGIVRYLWGREVSRALLFPIAFLVFMIPVSGPIDQATTNLQFLVVGMAQKVCGLIGMPLFAVGTKLVPVDEAFKGFDIAEGCSGIRSLTAMIMVTVIYVHLTQTKRWKQIVILLCSVGFAIVGNAGRIVSIFVVAKFFGPAFAGGTYHHASGYVSFPIALLAMVAVSKILDLPIFEPAKLMHALRAEEGKPGSGETLAKKETFDY